jgi:hypothetical protein
MQARSKSTREMNKAASSQENQALENANNRNIRSSSQRGFRKRELRRDQPGRPLFRSSNTSQR